MIPDDQEIDPAQLELQVADLVRENDRLEIERTRLTIALERAQKDADQGWKSFWMPEVKAWLQFRIRTFSRQPFDDS